MKSGNANFGIIVGGDAKGGVRAVRATREELDHLGKSQKSVKGDSRELANSTNSLDSSFDALTKRVLALTGAFYGMNAAKDFAGRIIQTGQQLEGFDAAMTAVTSSAALANKELLYSTQIAKDLGIYIPDAVGQFTKLTAAANGTTLAGQGTREIFEAISVSSRVLNLGMEQTQGAFRAIEQMISKGNVQAEELRGQLGERLPGAFQLAAAAMEVSTQELNDMLKAGDVLAEDMLPKLAEELKALYGPAIADVINGPSQAFRDLKNDVFEFYAAVANSGGFDALASMASALSGLLDALANNIDAVGSALLVVAGAYTASFLVAIGKKTAALALDTAETFKNALAQRELELRQAKVAAFASATAKEQALLNTLAAQSEANRLRSTLAALEAEAILENQRLKAQITDQGRIATATRMAEVQVARAAIVRQLTAAESQLTAATAAGVAAETTLAGATNALSAAQGRATVTATALGVATKFMLGPWGFLLTTLGTAAAAFLFTKDSSDELTASMDRQANEAERLEKVYASMSRDQFAAAYSEAQKKAMLIDQQRIDLKRKLIEAERDLKDAAAQGLGLGARGSLASHTAKQAEAVASLQAELKSLDIEAKESAKLIDAMSAAFAKLLPEIDKAPTAIGNTSAELEKAQKAHVNQIQALDLELLALRLTGDQYELYTARIQALNSKQTPEMIAAVEARILALQKERNAINATSTELDGLMSGELFGFGAAKEQKQLDSLLDSIYGIGEAWDSSGNVMLDTFGSMADGLESYSQKLLKISKEERKLAKERQEYQGNTTQLSRIAKAEQYLADTRTKAHLRSFADIAGGASKLFSEQSKGREALHKAELAFQAVELAMSLQRAGANALEAISAAFAAPWPIGFASGAAMIGIMAGLGLFSGSSGASGPSAEDIQAGQGTGTVFGDSSAKSDSINRAWERMEDIEIDQLAELQGIHAAMRGLTSGIERLAISLTGGLRFSEEGYSGQLGKINTGMSFLESGFGVANVLAKLDPTGLIGGIVSSFSSTKRDLKDSGIAFLSQTFGQILDSGEVAAQLYNTIETTKKKWWGLSKKTYTETEYSDLDNAIRSQMADLFGFVGDSVIEAAKLLGIETVTKTQTVVNSAFDDIDFGYQDEYWRRYVSRYIDTITTTTEMSLEEALAGFKINLPKISFKDLSGEEIQKELEAVFSQQADLIAKYLVPSIGQYQQIGEGLYDTVLRVAQEQVIFNDHLERTGQSMSDLSVTMQTDIAQSIISLMGGVDEFRTAANAFYSEFYSEREQALYLQQSITEALGGLNQVLPSSRDGWRDLVNGIDRTTAEGQQLFAALLKMSPALAEYYKILEDKPELLEDLTDGTDQLTDAERRLLEQRASWLASIEDQLTRLDLSGAALELFDLDKWYQGQIAQAEELGAETALLEILHGRKRQAVIDKYLAQINADTAKQMDALAAEHERAVADITTRFTQLFDAIRTASAGLADSMLQVRRAGSGWDEIGYQTGQISTLRGQLNDGTLEQQVERIGQLQAAIMARYDAQVTQLNDTIANHQSHLGEIQSAYEAISNAIAGFRARVDDAVLAVRRAMPAWDEITYQAQRVAQLKGQLSGGSIEQRLSAADQLLDATNAWYDAQIAQQQELANAELERFNRLRDAISGLNEFASGLGTSNLSNLKSGDQLALLAAQYNDLLGKTQAGDANAAGKLQGVSSDYLTLLRDYYGAGSAEYNDVFNQIKNALGSLDAPAESDVPSEVLAHQTAVEQLQQAQLSELLGMQNLVEQLQAEADAHYTAEMAYTRAAIEAAQAEIVDIQSHTLSELLGLQELLDQLNAQAIVEQTAALSALRTSFENSQAAILAAEQQQIAELQALTAAMLEVANNPPQVIVTPPPPVIITTEQSKTNPVQPQPVEPKTPDPNPTGGSNQDAVVTELKGLRKDVARQTSELRNTQNQVAKLARTGSV